MVTAGLCLFVIQPLRAHLRQVRSICLGQHPWAGSFSTDNTRLAVVGDCGVVEFDPKSWTRAWSHHNLGSSKITPVGRDGFAFDVPFGAMIIDASGNSHFIRLPNGLEYVYGIASRKGDLALSVTGDTLIFDVATSKLTRAAAHPSGFGGPIISAWEGFAGGDGWAQFFPASSPLETNLLKLPAGEGARFAFAQDKGELAIVGPSGQIYWLKTPRSAAKPLARPLSALPYGFAVTSDGGLIALGYKTNLQGRIPNEQNLLVLLDGRTGKVLQKVRRPDGIESLALNSSGTLLAELNRSRKLYVYSVARVTR